MKKKQSKQFCVHGHDTYEVGRDKHGSCKRCKVIQIRIDPNKDSRLKPICKRGHDTSVTGRDKKGYCKVCKRDREKSTKIVKKQFCPNGHDTWICGRNRRGHCNICFRNRRNKYYAKNKEKINARHRLNYPNWRLKQKDKDLQKRFGITLEQYYKILEKQNYSCAGCLRHQSNFTRALCVDHNHKTGKVRGLLCQTCNRLLGQIAENPNTLRRLANYLESD